MIASFSLRNHSPSRLEHIQNELVSLMIAAGLGVFVVPLPVVNRDSHFRRIAEIHVLAGAVVFVPPEILRIVNVGVVVEPLPVVGAIGPAPNAVVGAVGGFLGLAGGGK